MKRYVTDTQCIVWYLNQDRRLPRFAQAVFKATESGRAQILIPSIALVEAIFFASATTDFRNGSGAIDGAD